jgi:hypothetical protein
MPAKTITIQKRGSLEKAVSKEFTFTPEMVRALDPSWEGAAYLHEYRQKAWNDYLSLPIPVTTDEPWRRTDLKGLNAGSFRLADMDSPQEKAVGPDRDLLQPLAGDRHAGQIVLMPGETHRRNASPSQGLIFTDLITAETNILTAPKNIGSNCASNEGKFSAMAARRRAQWPVMCRKVWSSNNPCTPFYEQGANRLSFACPGFRIRLFRYICA